ncbi:MAG TPA: alpha/beta hydrolase [Proteiniclasticum sp.]|nr:alpha/beta hydrolase [Proteiniclasticum sp.]
MQLYVEESGKVGAPSIVFLHGVGTSSWMWWRQVSMLPDFHCLNVDLPGHGESVHVKWISLADTAHQIAKLIESRATNGRAHIVGLSLGAYIGLLLIEHHANLLDSAILSGVTSSPIPNRFLLGPQLWLISVSKRSRKSLEKQAKYLHLASDEQVAFVENFMKMSMMTYRTIYKEVVKFKVSSALEEANVPTLICAGGMESKVILQAVHMLPEILPDAKGCIAPGLDHGWNLEAPDLFNAMVRAWINQESLPSEIKMVRDIYE